MQSPSSPEIEEREYERESVDWKTKKKKTSIGWVIRSYPIPVFAIIGLGLGSAIKLSSNPYDLARWIWFATLVIGGLPIVWQTIKGMIHGHFASDIVAMLAIVSAILMEPIFAGVAFAGVVVVLMQSGGEAIEDYGLKRASSSLDALLERAPRIARRKNGEVLEEIEVSRVAIGDILVVRPGDLIPVDGVILSGQSQIDEAALTGEPLPKSKGPRDSVLSGGVNMDGAFEMRAEKVSGESQYAKIVKLVRKAQEEKPSIQRLADRYAVVFTPLTIAVAVIGFLITLNPVTVLSVLVVATPCPLILATPIAVISAVNRAAQEGIIVKGGAAIEQIGRAQVVVFDKTGTITFGSPFVERIIPVNTSSADELLFKAASVEQLSSHVVAQSIARRGLQKFGKLSIPTNFKETPGYGVEASLEGECIVIGSKRYVEATIEKYGGSASISEVIEETRSEGKLISFIALNGKIAGIIVFTDQMRAGVPIMIQKLHELGIRRTMMLTGDNAENAQAIARQVGIASVEANLLPSQKVDVLKRLKEEFDSVVMVGDGINDAPALATSTVGVAMGAHGTGISAEAADVVLLVDDVTAVSDAVYIGQRMLRIAKQGIFIGLGCSLFLMAIAALGFIPPAIGAMLQEVIDASVVLNALRAR